MDCPQVKSTQISYAFFPEQCGHGSILRVLTD
jgi:hypothetical protein